MWEACFIVSVVVFITFLIISLVKNNKKRKRFNVFRPRNYLFAGTFIASVIMFLPCYKIFFGESELAVLKTLALSVHNTIRLFVVDSDFEFIAETTGEITSGLKEAYQIHAAILFLCAPVLTFSFVLSFFKNVTAYIRLFFAFGEDLYVFSDLNEKSLALANDISAKYKRATIVFTDMGSEKENGGLIEKAEETGAIFFKKNISSVKISFRLKSKKTCFFIVGYDDDENVKICSELYKKYENNPDCAIYLFSESKQSELFFNGLSLSRKIKTVRVSEARSLIYNYLYEEGHKLFEGACRAESGEKTISAVVISDGGFYGCGKFAAKTLPWFCQLGGYRFKMTVLSEKESAESEFHAECPDFLDPSCNGVYAEGEAQYDIKVCSGINFEGYEFEQLLSDIKDVSFVFVSLGSDEKTIDCAAKAKKVYERCALKPTIVATVKDSEKIRAIENARATDGRFFGIEYVGDSESLYSEKAIVNSELEKRALETHMRYPASGLTKEEHERMFFSQEYSYNSSCASALHAKLRSDLGVAGANKKESELTEEEREETSVTEHRRWSAYVRSCGYVYSGSPEKSSRNDLAKVHNCLIPFNELTEEYRKIDTDVAVKK